jgi:hypothetical protein
VLIAGADTDADERHETLHHAERGDEEQQSDAADEAAGGQGLDAEPARHAGGDERDRNLQQLVEGKREPATGKMKGFLPPQRAAGWIWNKHYFCLIAA